MNQKKKIVIIAAIAAAVVLATAGIIIGVALSNDYLDSMKKYDYSSTDEYFYNGIEIVAEDGLFYLTKDGKKISKTGYSYLSSVNESVDIINAMNDYDEDNFTIYDYYLARKPDAKNYFLVKGDGTEIAVEGDTLSLYDIALPYISFKDLSTGKLGAVSLKNLNSDLSANAGSEIALNMFDTLEVYRLSNEHLQYGYAIGYTDVPGADSPSFTYFDENGAKLFDTIAGSQEPICISDGDEIKSYYFRTAEGYLYNLSGDLIAEDIISLNYDESHYYNGYVEYMLVTCSPEDETLSDDENLKNVYCNIISYKANTVIKNNEHELLEALMSDGNDFAEGNLLWLEKRSDDPANTQKTLFNLITGESVAVDYGIETVTDGLVRVQTTAPDAPSQLYSYVDAETGKTLLQSAYSDVSMYWTDVMCSGTEYIDKTAGMTENLPGDYLYFVHAGSEPVARVMGANEELVGYDWYGEDYVSYIIKTSTPVENASYSIDKYQIYIPFAADGAYTSDSYDKIQCLKLFNYGDGVYLASDYDSGKHDFIDVGTGKVFYTVTAEGADMAKISFTNVENIVMQNDEYNAESSVEIAVIEITKNDDNGNKQSSEIIAINRKGVIKKNETVSAEISVTSLGSGLYDGGELEGYYDIEDNWVEYWDYDYVTVDYNNYLIVHPTDNSTKVFRLTDACTLEELCTVPYYAQIAWWGDTFEEAYLYVYDRIYDLNMENVINVGVYTLDGKEIVAPVYNYIDVCDAEYIIAERNGGYGVLKYNAKKEKVKTILDFKFDYIEYVSDGGFVVEIGDDCYLYEGKDRVKSERIVNEDYKFIYDVSYSEETGRYQMTSIYVYNIGGKAYVHRAEPEDLVRGNYYGHPSNIVEIDNSFATVVNFRDANGELIDSKVVYNTDKSRAEFAALDSGAWYYTASKDFQNEGTKVTFVIPTMPEEPVEPTEPIESDYSSYNEYLNALEDYHRDYSEWHNAYNDWQNGEGDAWENYNAAVESFILNQYDIVDIYKAHTAELFN